MLVCKNTSGIKDFESTHFGHFLPSTPPSLSGLKRIDSPTMHREVKNRLFAQSMATLLLSGWRSTGLPSFILLQKLIAAELKLAEEEIRNQYSEGVSDEGRRRRGLFTSRLSGGWPRTVPILRL